MTLRRILLVGTNVVLLAAFGPFTSELLFTELSRSTFKISSLSLPASTQWPAQPELDHTLFRARPLSVVSENQPFESNSTPKVRLLGVILTERQRVAMVDHDGATLRVEEGDALDEWQITAIAARKIRLQNAEQNVDVFLDTPSDPH